MEQYRVPIPKDLSFLTPEVLVSRICGGLKRVCWWDEPFTQFVIHNKTLIQVDSWIPWPPFGLRLSDMWVHSFETLNDHRRSTSLKISWILPAGYLLVSNWCALRKLKTKSTTQTLQVRHPVNRLCTKIILHSLTWNGPRVPRQVIRNKGFYWSGFPLSKWPDILPCPSDTAVADEVRSELKLPPLKVWLF